MGRFGRANGAALKHGGSSDVQIVRRSTVERRRLLRQIGLRQDDLESVGRALLVNWSRAAAALHLMDEYAERKGWLDEDGSPRGFARLYVSMLNAERLALKALGDHLRARDPHLAGLDALILEGKSIREQSESNGG